MATEFSKSVEQDMALFLRRFHLPRRADMMLRDLMERAYQAGQVAGSQPEDFVSESVEVNSEDRELEDSEESSDRDVADVDSSLRFGEGSA